MKTLIGLIFILFLIGFIIVAVVGIILILRAVVGSSESGATASKDKPLRKPATYVPPEPYVPRKPYVTPTPPEPPSYVPEPPFRSPMAPPPPAPTSDTLPYQRQYRFLSNAERSFYGVLCQVIPDTQVIMAKVRLADIIKVEKGNREFYNWHNKIDRKHLDFVVCDRQTMQIDFCVELDDKSHDREHRKERDAFVDAAMESAKVPLIHIRCQHTYNLDDVRRQIEEATVKTSV